MRLNSLKDLYVQELQDAYDCENQIVKTLPKVAKAASSSELQRALQEHLEQSWGHVKRLEQIFESMGQKPKAKKCDGVKGILDEGSKLLENEGDSSVVDAGLIAGAQRVEHYEMAVYGSLKAWAGHFGDQRATALLELTLGEEKNADAKLTEIARSVNVEAANPGGAGQAV